MPHVLWWIQLSKELPKFVPTERFAGMQVIDSKGSMVGNVKDVSVDFRNKALAFRVATKAHTEMDIPWDEILSQEDVVLLKDEVELPTAKETITPPSIIPVGPPSGPVVQAAIICPSCGTSVPGHAKFCPRCGANLK
jgi:sporulation protein YlmC with PRC-barrel domain